MVSNKDLLHGIHKVPVGICVKCNAGVTTLNKKGYLGDFPEPVWYNPHGFVNLLSLYVVGQHYHVQYDNQKKDAFVLTTPDSVKVGFKPTRKGLYSCSASRTDPASEAWAFINLSEDHKAEYTKQEYRDAVRARKVQNIVMFPGDRAFKKIIDSNQLANCPVT
jgi:hypothetical protein